MNAPWQQYLVFECIFSGNYCLKRHPTLFQSPQSTAKKARMAPLSMMHQYEGVFPLIKLAAARGLHAL